MIRTRPASTLLATALATALLAGCGGDEPPGATPAPAASAPATTAAAAGGGSGGGGGGTPVKVLDDVDPQAALAKIGQKLPGNQDPVGGTGWTDSAGENLLVLSASSAPGKPHDVGNETTSYNLRADLFTTKGGTTKRVRVVTDGFKDCEFDSYTEFQDKPEVSDADGDGIGEVLFGYTLGCISDTSPVEFKLLALEGADKYILRGETYTSREVISSSGPLAKTTNEPAFSAWPSGLQAEAERRWDAWTIWR
jgi:hypothetical protein